MNLKKLKSLLNQKFSVIRSKTKNGEMPTLDEATEFCKLCKQLHLNADDEWQGEAEDFAHLSVQLLQAVRKSNSQESILLVDSLHDARLYCHRSFKSK